MNFRDFFTISTWWGKILGAFFGYLSLGPIGALLGIIIGNLFDIGLFNHFSNPHLLYHAEKRKLVQKVFFESTFSVMGHIAKADGHVSKQEINMAKLMMKEMRLNSQQREIAKHLFNEGKQIHFKLDTVLTQLQKVCEDNHELLKLFLDTQYRAAQVDGLSTKKIQRLNIIFARLGFAPLHQQYRFYEDFNYTSYAHHQQEQQRQWEDHSSSSRYQHSHHSSVNLLSQAYAIMEISPDSSKQEVKQAYRRLLSRHHPDKLIAKGVSEEKIKWANDKTQKIVKAYELICKTKGW